MFRMPDGTVQIAVQGLERVSINEVTEEKPYLMGRISLKPDTRNSIMKPRLSSAMSSVIFSA